MHLCYGEKAQKLTEAAKRRAAWQLKQSTAAGHNRMFQRGQLAALGPIQPKGVPAYGADRNRELRRLAELAESLDSRTHFGWLHWDTDEGAADEYCQLMAERVEGILSDFGRVLPGVDDDPWPPWFGAMCYDAAKTNPRTFWGWFASQDVRQAIFRILDAHELEPIDSDSVPAAQLSELLKITKPAWWVRQWRKAYARRLDELARALGQVRKFRAPYCADITVDNWRRRQVENWEALKATEAENEAGQKFDLADLVARSNANPAIRRAEMMTRLRGFEIYARDRGYRSEFWTITAPSRFHPTKTITKGRKSRAVENSKWVAAGRPTVRAAQQYLCTVWARIRADLARLGCDVFGFRITEPHGDGCPHWHLLVFLPADMASRFDSGESAVSGGYPGASSGDAGSIGGSHAAAPEQHGSRTGRSGERLERSGGRSVVRLGSAAAAARRQSLIDNPDEPGAQRARFDCEPIRDGINPDTGEPFSAVGYVAKYIAKNLDGVHAADEPDHTGGGTLGDNARRVRAWASTHGVRQFQQFGGPSVTVWRELRRLYNDPEQWSDNEFLQAVFAQTEQEDKAEAWAAFCALHDRAQLSAIVLRAQRLVTESHCSAINFESGTFRRELRQRPLIGKHGLPVVAVTGLRLNGRKFTTRPHVWTLRPKSVRIEPEPPDWGLLLPDRPKAGTAWTRVNNCTGARPPAVRTFDDLKRWERELEKL